MQQMGKREKTRVIRMCIGILVLLTLVSIITLIDNEPVDTGRKIIKRDSVAVNTRYYLEREKFDNYELLYITDRQTNKRILDLYSNIDYPDISPYGYSPNGRCLVVSPSTDETDVKAIDLNTGKIKVVTPYPGNMLRTCMVTSVHNDNRHFLYRFGDRSQIGILEYDLTTKTGKTLFSYPGCEHEVWGEYSASGKYIILMSVKDTWRDGAENRCYTWVIDSQTHRKVSKALTNKVLSKDRRKGYEYYNAKSLYTSAR